MAPLSALQQSTDLRTADRFFLAPLDGSEVTLDARLWELVLALGVAEQVDVIAEVLDVAEEEIFRRLETLDALGVLDVVVDDAHAEPEAIAPGALSELVAADAVDIDAAELISHEAIEDDPEPIHAPADLVELEHDDDSMRAMVYRFLGTFED